MPPPTCLNCGANLGGRFCFQCGQDGQRRLLGLFALARRITLDLMEVDGTFLRTFRTLLTRPGRLTRDYAAGRFKQQLPPSRLYLASAAVYFFFAPMLSNGTIRADQSDGSFLHMEVGPLTWDSELLLLLLVPIWALAVRIVLVGKARYFEEAFVFSVHYNVFFLACMLVLAVLIALCNQLGVPGAAIWLVPVGLFAPLAYLVGAITSAFDIKSSRRLIIGSLLFFIHLGLGQGAFNALSALAN